MSPTKIVRRDAPLIDDREASSPALAGIDVRTLNLVGRDATIDIGPRITACQLERTIVGASTLTPTVHDPDLQFLNSAAIKGAQPGDLYADTVIDNQVFSLAGLQMQDRHLLQVTLEAEAIHRLRKPKGPLTMSRGKVTRAQFLKRLCDDVGVEFICPELGVKQPIAPPPVTKASKRRNRQSGLSALANCTAKGKKLSANQIQEVNALLGQAATEQADKRGMEAVICAGIQETVLGDDPSSYKLSPDGFGTTGVLQVGTGRGASSRVAGTGIGPHDTAKMAHYFFVGGKGMENGGAIAFARKNPQSSPGDIARHVENPGSSSQPYQQWEAEARKIVAAYNGSDPASVASAGQTTFAKVYQYQRGKHEDSWTAMRRLADEVKWYLFEVAGAVYFMSGPQIMKAQEQMLVAPGADGIDKVLFSYFTSPKHDDTVTVTCRAGAWSAAPGEVVKVEGYGPIDGRWLTTDIVRASMTSPTTTVTLGRPQKPQPEPPHQTGTRTTVPGTQQTPGGLTPGGGLAPGGGLTPGGGLLPWGSLRERVVAAAKHAASLSSSDPSHYHYSQSGGWKTDLYARDKASDRSDCSSFVVQCYVKAGCSLPASMHNQGFTGTFADAGHKTTHPKPGDVCLYGTYPYHHMELYIGDGKTIGHGTPTVHYGTPGGPGGLAGYWTFDFLDGGSAPGSHPKSAPHKVTLLNPFGV